jgi:uncharacterized protein (UPF0248 family)
MLIFNRLSFFGTFAMMPIHRLLDRIRWDREFGRAAFTIGYLERLEQRLVQVAFSEIIMTPDSGNAFQVLDNDGVMHTVPLHRIREVYRNGELIWQRPPA